MTSEELEKRLAHWRQGLWISVGVVAMLLLFALYGTNQPHKVEVLTWYYTWLAFQLLITPPGFILLLGRFGRSLPLSDRLSLAFSYFLVAWLALLSFGIQTGSDSSIWSSPWASVVLVAGIGGSGAVLAVAYWLTRKAYLATPEEVFP